MKGPVNKVEIFSNTTFLLHIEKWLIKDYLKLTINKFSERQRDTSSQRVGMKYLFGSATTEDVAKVKRKFHSFAQNQKKIIKTLNKENSLLTWDCPTLGKVTSLIEKSEYLYDSIVKLNEKEEAFMDVLELETLANELISLVEELPN